jgi:hypothetical protein
MHEPSPRGQPATGPAGALGRQSRSLTPLIAVTIAALVFAILLILVRLQWAPLESVDHGAAADINGGANSSGSPNVRHAWSSRVRASRDGLVMLAGPG